MDNRPSQQPPGTPSNPAGPPGPEVLKPRADEVAIAQTNSAGSAPGESTVEEKKAPKRAYRPSHKATFIGLAVVVAILSVNAIVLMFILKNKSDENEAAKNQVTISPGVLEGLGVNTDTVGSAGTKLTVGPDAEFLGKMTVAGESSFGGPLKFNGQVAGTNASFVQLSADTTTLKQLNVSGNSTFSNLGVRGETQLQGPVVMSQLVTIRNSLNISGNISIGGTMFANSLRASNLIANSTLAIGGHIITTGPTPGISKGAGIGNNGTVSISGNDAAGTVAVNIGAGGGSGIVAHISFRNNYSATPHVVLTPVGSIVNVYYVTRNSAGFNIGVSGLSPGGYSFDYMVKQ